LKLNSNSIRNQEFAKKVFGFNSEEVKTFLNRMADEIDLLLKENEELKYKLRNLAEQIEEYKEIENNLKQTLLKAQESSSKSIESTKKQAQFMLMEAEIKANQIIENAKEQAKKLNEAILNLQEEKNFIIAKLEAILNTQIRLINPDYKFDTSKTFEENIQNVDFIKIDIDKIVDSLEND
jgi:cell division initiation protein